MLLSDNSSDTFHPSRQVGRVSLVLLQEGDKPWITGLVTNIAFLRSSFIDRSGSIQAQIGGVVLRDAEGGLQATKGTPPGVILCHWDPNPSWINEPTLMLVARHGAYVTGKQKTIQNMELQARPERMQSNGS
jgi:hypothetical protein